MSTVRVLNQQLRKGVRLWNQGRYWHCHEAWEQVWLKLKGRERSYLQGCIQAAAVQVLITKDRRQASVRVAERALELLGSRMPSGSSGLRLPKIPGIRKALHTFIREAANGKGVRFRKCAHRNPLKDGRSSNRLLNR